MPDSTQYDLECRPTAYWTAKTWDDADEESDRWVAIASIHFLDRTGSIIWVEARPHENGIGYAISEDCGDEFPCSITESTRPLSLVELISVIDNAHIDTLQEHGLIIGSLIYSEGEAGKFVKEECLAFIQVESDFYPQIGRWYWEVIEEWCSKTNPQ